MRKKLILILALIAIPITSAASAAPCEKKVCVQVVTDPTTNRIIITAVQNKPGSTTKPKVHKAIKPLNPSQPLKPRVARTYAPKPVITKKVTSRPRVVRATKKPVPKVAVSLKPKVVAAVSL